MPTRNYKEKQFAEEVRQKILAAIREGIHLIPLIEQKIGVSPIGSRVGKMVTDGLIYPVKSGKRNTTGNIIYHYYIGSREQVSIAASRKTTEPLKYSDELFTAWPVTVPKVSNKPKVFKLTDEQYNNTGISVRRGYGICSSMDY